MKLIIGLGNPGSRYDDTRHNAGASVVKMIAQENGVSLRNKKFDSIFGIGDFWGEHIMLMLPQTYMNLSGRAAGCFISWKKLFPQEILVVCDDVNLELGNLRIKEGGSHGGHNGLRSVIEELGTESFPRLRIGVGSGKPGKDLEEYVLGEFNPGEVKIFKAAAAEAMACCESWASRGMTCAMNNYNKKNIEINLKKGR